MTTKQVYLVYGISPEELGTIICQVEDMDGGQLDFHFPQEVKGYLLKPGVVPEEFTLVGIIQEALDKKNK